MKRTTFYLLLIIVVLLTACTNDDSRSPEDEMVEVNVSLSVASATQSRAWDNTQSDNGDGEKMQSWFVVIVNNQNTITRIIEKTAVNDLERDEYGKVLLHAGTYTFYSFANISRADVLGDATEGDDMPDLSTKTFTIKGIDYNADGLPTDGIPMSNSQTFDIDSSADISLWVVRMVAKMQLLFTNDMGHDVTINSVTLSNVTADGDNNIYLLPKPTDEGESSACQPNVPEGTEQTDMVLTPDLTIAEGEEQSFTFYVNETTTPTTAQGRFLLTLSLSYDGQTDEKRYALITNDDDNWDFIARNDHRTLPITLDDYTLDILPYDFTPIGVYPASVKEEDGLFTCTFYNEGHFHLQPVVTKRSTGATLTYGTDWTEASWTLSPDDNPLGKNDDIYYSSTDTSDTGDNGGAPVWDSRNAYLFGSLNGTVGKAYHELIVSVNKGSTSLSLPYRIMVIKK